MSADQRFFDFLKRRIGLDVASVGPAIIERAVRQRCTALNMQDHDQYWQRLNASADEQQALIESVIVPETWFFRYPESFSTLGRLARERLAAQTRPRVLRLLSLPCSTGEEPYSIAMAMFDAGFAAHQFKVDALDISPLSIQRAQRAVYGKNSFRGQDISFRERHFSLEADGYHVSARVRNQIHFQVGNVLDPALTASQPPYDFVFCRNLLIYFDLNTQQQALDALTRMTRLDGVLFIGPAEGSLLHGLGMRSISAAQSFAFCHSQALPAVLPTQVERTPQVRPLPLPVVAVSRPFAARPLTPQRPPIQAAHAPVQEADGVLETIARLANEGKSREARALCEQALHQHGPQAQVFYWLGLLSDVEGQTAQVQGFYRKALYLEPQHAEALAHLAALLASQGDVAGAQRLQARAARNERALHSERKS